MGFSLFFLKMKNKGQEGRDIDRNLLKSFLEKKKLTISKGGMLEDENGKYLAFDGNWADLYLEPLDSEKPLSARIYHATLSDEECAFLFEMCDAVGWLIVNPQGAPSFIVPNKNHSEDALPDDEDDVVFIKNASELQEVLSGGFDRFKRYLKRIKEQDKNE